ncbi:MAG: hypothetical protein E7350_01755 [Clostridiales bacterium]|nr:hypothetical protein [Clostridiales bacterium]
MGFFDLFRRSKKGKYIVDKTEVKNEYIENRFQFLVDCGYDYMYYQKNAEREFVYSLNDCRVDVILDGDVFDCIIKTKDFGRANITQNPLVVEGFKEQFYKATNVQRVDMVVNLIHENADVFCIK